MTGKKSISIKHFLRISLAVMLLFLFIISTVDCKMKLDT